MLLQKILWGKLRLGENDMNFRLFSILFSIIISVLLFSVGIVMLIYINAEPNYAIKHPDNSFASGQNGILGALVDPFKDSLDSLKMENKNLNILMLGGDFVGANTDTMIVVNINPLKRKVKLLSIPRDTRIEVNNGYQKINYAYAAGGGQFACKTVENLLGIRLDYYVYININTFRYIIDALGGVDFEVTQDMDYDDSSQDLHIHLTKGMQHLDGAQSEGFMRFRQYNSGKVTQYYDGSDILRIKGQQEYIKQFIKQKANLYSMTKFKDVLELVLKNMDTNLNLNDILKLLSFSNNFDLEDIKMITIPGTSEDGENWYYILDKEKSNELLEEEDFNSLEPKY